MDTVIIRIVCMDELDDHFVDLILFLIWGIAASCLQYKNLDFTCN